MTSDVTFIQVGALANGFELESNLLPNTRDLVGKKYQLYFSNKESVYLCFDSSETLSFDSTQYIDYRCTVLRKGIYFVDFLNPSDKRGTISIVLDVENNNTTLVYGQLPTAEDTKIAPFTRINQNLSLTDVNVEIYFGSIDSSSVNDKTHHFTDELIGYRNQYIYSATEKYEHIYLNQNFYAWHCIDGVEKGLADVDRCHYIKIAQQLYLFIWREKIVPTLGVILIDMSALRTDGKIVGYKEEDFKALSNFQVGSFAEVLHKLR